MENISGVISSIKDSILQNVPAKYIYLFGSHAYGQPHADSDIDIYLVVPDDIESLLETYGNIIYDLSDKNIFSVDLILSRESNFHVRKNRNLFEETIVNKGRLIYENT